MLLGKDNRGLNFFERLGLNLMPKKLKYWVAIEVMVHGTTGKYSSQVVPELTALDGLKRYGKDFALE